jgi:hypothetical protein
MGLGFLYFIGWTLLASVLGLAIYFIWMANRDKEDPENQSILINFMSQYSDGFSLGLIESIDKSKDLTKIVFYPRDLNYIRLAKKDKNFVLKPQTIFVANRCLIYCPAGSLSSFRNFIIALPPQVEEIPENLKLNRFGEAIMTMVGKAEEEIREGKILRSVIKSQQRLQEEGLPEEMVKDYMEKQFEMSNSRNPSSNLGDKEGDK